MLSISKKGGANHMYHDPQSGHESSNHVSTGRWNVAIVERRNWNDVIHHKCSDFCCSNVREHSLNSLKLTSTCFLERNLHRSFNKNLYLLHVLSFFEVSNQELELFDDFFHCLIRKPTPNMDQLTSLHLEPHATIPNSEPKTIWLINPPPRGWGNPPVRWGWLTSHDKKWFGKKNTLCLISDIFFQNSNNTFLEFFSLDTNIRCAQRTPVPNRFFFLMPLRSGASSILPSEKTLPLGSEDIDKGSHYALEETSKQHFSACT